MIDRLDNADFWELYWEEHLAPLQNQGKREAILAASGLIRQLAPALDRPLRLLELGCGEGQILGPLVEAHPGLVSRPGSLGVDYQAGALKAARRAYPSLPFRRGDLTDPNFAAGLGSFEIVLLVNALHEVFSFDFSMELGEVNVPHAKEKTAQALCNAARQVASGGALVLFDGLEPPGDPRETVRVRFEEREALEHFQTFAREYHPFRVRYQTTPDPLVVELSRFYFTRYLTKSIFLGKPLWQSERLESYQYFNEGEFRAAFERAGLHIQELRTLTVDEENWRRRVEILTPGGSFPEEHILILARKEK